MVAGRVPRFHLMKKSVSVLNLAESKLRERSWGWFGLMSPLCRQLFVLEGSDTRGTMAMATPPQEAGFLGLLSEAL
jgi:hypothetical protein